MRTSPGVSRQKWGPPCPALQEVSVRTKNREAQFSWLRKCWKVPQYLPAVRLNLGARLALWFVLILSRPPCSTWRERSAEGSEKPSGSQRGPSLRLETACRYLAGCFPPQTELRTKPRPTLCAALMSDWAPDDGLLAPPKAPPQGTDPGRGSRSWRGRDQEAWEGAASPGTLDSGHLAAPTCPSGAGASGRPRLAARH